MDKPTDRAAFERQVLEQLPRALRFAVRITGDADCAEEIVQEAMLRASQSWHTYRGQALFRTWLFRIILNVFRDRLRHTRTNVGLSLDIDDPKAAEPSVELEAKEFERFVARCVSALPPRQREVLVLSAYEGFTAMEIAELLQITTKNVYATLHVARGRIREQLSPYWANR